MPAKKPNNNSEEEKDYSQIRQFDYAPVVLTFLNKKNIEGARKSLERLLLDDLQTVKQKALYKAIQYNEKAIGDAAHALYDEYQNALGELKAKELPVFFEMNSFAKPEYQEKLKEFERFGDETWADISKKYMRAKIVLDNGSVYSEAEIAEAKKNKSKYEFAYSLVMGAESVRTEKLMAPIGVEASVANFNHLLDGTAHLG